ncbi:MAG TPA: hypothetical protein VI299_26325, partial [Polyangiales bacterium]
MRELHAHAALRVLHLLEHVIERAGELVDLVRMRRRRAHRIVAARRDRRGHLRKLQDRPGDAVLELSGDEVSEQPRSQQRDRDDAGVKAHASVERAQVRAHEQRAQAPGALHDGLEADQVLLFEPESRVGIAGSLREPNCRRALGVHSEEIAPPVVERSA